MNYKIFILIILFPMIAIGATDISSLPWSSTIDCDAWEYNRVDNGDDINCTDDENALLHHLHGNDCGGTDKNAEIISAANHAAGGGGRGLRHWECDGEDNRTGAVKVSFSPLPTEVWVRWYMRYQEGFTWEWSDRGLLYDKMLYFNGNIVIPEWKDADRLNIYMAGSNHNSSVGTGWDTIMAAGDDDEGHKASDGQWHLYEVHVKAGIGDGVLEFWIDEVLRLQFTNQNLGTGGFSNIAIGHNQVAPENGGPRYVDFDDIVISDTGYIGSATKLPLLLNTVISANGLTTTLTYDENVSQGSGYNNSDLKMSCTATGPNIGFTYVSGDGTPNHIYTLEIRIQDSGADTCTIDFNGDANSLENDAGEDLEEIIDGEVTNNSESPTPPKVSAIGGCFNCP